MCFMVIYGFYSFTLFFFHKRVAVAYQHLSVFFPLRCKSCCSYFILPHHSFVVVLYFILILGTTTQIYQCFLSTEVTLFYSYSRLPVSPAYC